VSYKLEAAIYCSTLKHASVTFAKVMFLFALELVGKTLPKVLVLQGFFKQKLLI